MQREFLINFFLLLFVNLLVKPLFIFGIDLGVQNRLPPGDYGLYFALLNFAYLFQIIGDFGLQSFNNRHVSQHPHLVGKYLPTLLVLKVLLSGVYIFFALAAAYCIRYDKRAIGLLFILLLNQVLSQGVLFLRSTISGLGYYRLDSVLSSADKLLMLLTCGLLLWGLPPRYLSAESFAWAQTLASSAALIAVSFVLYRRMPARMRWPDWGSRRWRNTLAALFRASFPYALVILLMSAYTRMDAILLERLLPDGHHHADVYAAAYRLLDAANMVGYLFAVLLLPMFARLLAQGASVRPLVGTATRLLWAGAVTMVLLTFFVRADLLLWMMPERADSYRWDVLGLLIWAFIPMGAIHIFSSLLTADGQLMAMSRFFVVGIALDLALDLWLIPRYQAIGAAIAAVCTQSFVAASMIFLCFRRFRWEFPRKIVGSFTAYGGILGAVGMLLFAQESWPILYQTIFFVALALIVAVLFRLLPLRQVFVGR